MDRNRQATGRQSLTLVLLPGLDGTGKLFQPFLSLLPTDLPTQVITYPTANPLDLSELAAYVRDQLPEGPLILLAESFSGLVALELLRSNKLSPKAVVFCASFAVPPRPRLLWLIQRIPFIDQLTHSVPDSILKHFCMGGHATQEQLDSLREVLTGIPPRIIKHRLSLIARFQADDKSRFEIPCYYLQAMGDRLVPASANNWFQGHFIPFHLRQIEGPHFLLQSQPEACAEQIASLVNQVTETET
ncbi:MAG: alpha/beta fold hydrolase [Candidatus Thiodiazotropha sp. (ex Myrtea spinifera)]|nr:alpha/beta fold hydrolase [Candidatus Thiodiazotropha sp. (ex Myrtea spinifera)]MCU7828454.1 alpha/beta fold hydrolase [Candidatus Thiodiazotropha sp. (ex Myrtea sp. 'scaly one' KF741663)]